MKTVKSIIVAVLVAGSMAVQAEAGGQGVNGLVMGAGGGALVGQAIGRDTEGTLIGTAVGGMLGYIVGNEMEKQSDTTYASDNGYASAQPAVFLPTPSPPPNVVVSFGGRRDHRHYGPIERCRDIVTVKCWYGRCREVIRTECRDRWRDRDWHRDRHWRGDRHWHGDRDDRWRDRYRHRDRW